MLGDIVYHLCISYDKGLLNEDEFTDELVSLGLDSETINRLLSLENNHRRRKHADRKRANSEMRKKYLYPNG